MRLTLPYPPSANRYWRTRVAGRGPKAFVQTYPSDEAKAFKASTALQARQQLGGLSLPIHPTEPVAITVVVYRPMRRGDLDNRLKVLRDALKGVVYADDEQVVEILAIRRDDKADPRVVVTFEAHAETEAA